MTRHVRSGGGLASSLGAAAAAIVTTAVALTGSAAAASTRNTITSQDWSGYAAHSSTLKFRSVSGRWRVPTATCVDGTQTFSSVWVGIGGYDLDSSGLDQDGIELDCNADGSQSVSAWYELLPAGAHTIPMTVHSGDLISASVRHDGETVTLQIRDTTRQESFAKTVQDKNVDDTSAEWITEAPEDCAAGGKCTVLALADFGTVRFADAKTSTTEGATSGVSTNRWTTTRLLLGYEKQGSAFVARSTGGSATPSSLTDRDHTFDITWSGTLTSVTSGASGSSGSSGSSGASGPSGLGSPGDTSGPGGAIGPGGTLNPPGADGLTPVGQGDGQVAQGGGTSAPGGGTAGPGAGPAQPGGGPGGRGGGPSDGTLQNFWRLS